MPKGGTVETNLYRKYRPNNFDQIVGQQVVVQTLINSIKNQSIAHAYLFSGVRGTGKTSIAKIFAKAINCSDYQQPLCGSCDVCVEFASNAEIPDIFEIDAASNNGVEEIRRIIDNVKYMPIRMKYKVYIIDEVHMLSKGAFNALLKTLEEPPAHVIFILATTEPNKIPVTILSRVQRFEFSRIDDELMLNHLCTVLDLEQIAYDVEALKLIVTHAQGGLRDALSLLTKVISYASEVTNETVTASLNLAAKSVTADLLESIVSNDTPAVSSKFQELIAGGADEAYLVQDIIEAAKSKLIEGLADSSDTLLVYTKIITRLMEALANIKIISNSCLYIEIALIELSIKPKQVVSQTLSAAPTPTPVVSEQQKIDKLQKQAAMLSASTQPKVETQRQSTTSDEQALEQIDILFANKTGKDVSGLKAKMEDNQVVDDEPIDSEFTSEVVEEDNYQQSIASSVADSQVANDEVVASEVVVAPVDPEIENITIIDTLKSATKRDKQALLIAAKKATNELNNAKQYGIAKFFEISNIQGASATGVVVSIDQNFYQTYEHRLPQIQQIYSNQIGSAIKVHLITTQYWKQERANFVRAVKENKQVDIYQEAANFFGKEIVNKVNT